MPVKSVTLEDIDIAMDFKAVRVVNLEDIGIDIDFKAVRVVPVVVILESRT